MCIRTVLLYTEYMPYIHRIAIQLCCNIYVHSVILVDVVQKEEGSRKGNIYEKMVDEEYDECEDPPEISFYDKDGVEWSKNPGYTSNVLEGEVGYYQNEKQGMTSTAIGGTDTGNVIDSLGIEQAEAKYMNVSEEPVQDATLIQNAAFEDPTEEEYVNTSESCTNPLKDTASSITPPVEEEYMSMD